MKGRDCILLFVCLSIIWISLPSSSNLSVVQKWRIPFDTSVFRNSHFPEEHEKLPLPVVTDINSDGKNDIIYVTTEFEVKIASSADIYELGEEIADSSMVAFSQMKLFSSTKDSHLKLKLPDLTATYTASLLPQFAITYGRKPVALAVGYIDPPGSVLRNQVIVVLTDGWVVMCFDFQLNLLWESHAVENPNPSLVHKEASILIDPTPLTNGDRGVIIVGGRKDVISNSETISHEHYDKKEFLPNSEELHKMKDEALDPPEPRKRIRKLQSIENDNEEEEDEEDGEENYLPLNTKEISDELDAGNNGDDVEDDNIDLADEIDERALKEETARQKIEALEMEQKKREEKIRKEEMKRRKENLQNDDSGDDDDGNNAHEEQNHFSYYAFEGHTGALRWKHEPGDFEDLGDPEANIQQAVDIFSQPSAGAETPDMALKLHLYHNLRHLGERDWSFFADDIAEQLPFVWRTREDTSLHSYYFDRERNFGNPQKVGDTAEEMRTYFKRNVAVARSSHGIEVLHLYSGRPLTRLELASESMYLDLNNDGVIDRVQAVPEKPQHKKRRRSKKDTDSCLAYAVSGVPTIEKLFEKNVCSSSSFNIFSFGMDRLRNNADSVDMANPTFAFAGNRRFNTIFLVSTGRITALDPEGEIIWQADTSATWSKVDTVTKKSSRATRFGKVESFLEMGGFPSIQPFSIYGSDNMVVAVGYHTLSVVSSETGVVEAETRLPAVANGPIVVGDWDSDGDYDIIVPCINGFIGMRITKGSGTPLYSIMFGLIILSLPILYFMNQPSKKKRLSKSMNENLMM